MLTRGAGLQFCAHRYIAICEIQVRNVAFDLVQPGKIREEHLVFAQMCATKSADMKNHFFLSEVPNGAFGITRHGEPFEIGRDVGGVYPTEMSLWKNYGFGGYSLHI